MRIHADHCQILTGLKIWLGKLVACFIVLSVRSIFAFTRYLAARGDFVEEFDNYAEWVLQDIYFSPEDRALLKSLKMTVVKIYQARCE